MNSKNEEQITLEAALNEMQQVLDQARPKDDSSRRERQLTKSMRIRALEIENKALRQALTVVDQSVRRWSAIIAGLYKMVPGAKEVIDSQLPHLKTDSVKED
jgi:hypothetical protein